MDQRASVLSAASRPSKLRPTQWCALLTFAGVLWSCSQAPVPSAATPPQGVAGRSETEEPAVSAAPLIPAGDLFADQIDYELAIYYLPTQPADPLPELKTLLESKYPLFKFSEAVPDEAAATSESEQETRDGATPAPPVATEPTVTPRTETDVPARYSPPDPEMLARFGHGLSDEQIEQLLESKHALILHFSYPRKHVWEGLRAAQGLMADLAVASGGLIWDEETREVFTPEAWKERLEEMTDDVPVIVRHTVIHAYRKDDYIRAITLGMVKFGLPDIVVENVSSSLTRNTGHLMNLFAQALAEGATVRKTGEFDLDLKTIRNPRVRENHLPHLLENATGVAQLTLRKGTWEEGDPKNRLIELTFDRETGPDSFARHESVLSKTFGSSDNVTRIKHDAELEAASARAKAKLSALRDDFNKGLAPGETLLVKAPFETPDENQEWMWVEVVRWKENAISGLLMNEPHAILDLHAGQKVEVSQADVFDYIRRLPDGSMEGNETGKIIGRQSGK